MGNPALRLYGILSDDGDCLYGYETLDLLLESVFDDGEGPVAGQTLIRIDAYTVLAEGSSEKQRSKDA